MTVTFTTLFKGSLYNNFNLFTSSLIHFIIVKFYFFNNYYAKARKTLGVFIIIIAARKRSRCCLLKFPFHFTHKHLSNPKPLVLLVKGECKVTSPAVTVIVVPHNR